MTTDDEDVVVVTALGLGNDVEGDTGLGDGVNLELRVDLLASLDGGNESSSVLLADTENGGVVLEGLAKGTRERAGDVVVDEKTDGASLLGGKGLGTEGALATGDEDDVAGSLSRVVGSGAAKALGINDGASGSAGGGVGHDLDVDLLAVDAQGAGTGRVGLGKGLLVDVIVAGVLEGVVEEVDGGVVAGAAKDTGALVGIGNVLELLGTGADVLLGDQVLQSVGADIGLSGRVALAGRSQGGNRQGESSEGGGDSSHFAYVVV